MRKFFLFGLILALVFFATTLLGYRDKVLTAFGDVQAEIVSKLTFKETTSSNAVEVNGISFETLVPKRVWKIPAKNSQAENPVEIGIRITNKTQAPVRFTRLDPLWVIRPEIARTGTDGSLLRMRGVVDIFTELFNSSQEYRQSNYNCQLVLPGESLTFFPEAKLFWEDEQLTLGEPDRKRSRWYIRLPEVGTYKVRLIYNYPPTYPELALAGCFDPNAVSRTWVETGLWTGKAITPYVEVQIVQ